MNGFKRRLGSFKLDNKPSEFPKLVAEAKKYIRKGISPVYGLEDKGGYGKALAVYLVEQKHTVKEVTLLCLMAFIKPILLYRNQMNGMRNV
ncbi:hypothetical protein MH117_01985 [Paenibacillus sp. ACRRX]|nr:hypothetical protein [Paenibacillus sp. ACRRX]